jgi:hypothetical protein
MRVLVLCVLVHKAHGHCDCCEAMHRCACLCALVHKAHGHCDCCEAMHACACLWMNKARSHMGLLGGDACVCLFVDE